MPFPLRYDLVSHTTFLLYKLSKSAKYDCKSTPFPTLSRNAKTSRVGVVFFLLLCISFKQMSFSNAFHIVAKSVISAFCVVIHSAKVCET